MSCLEPDENGNEWMEGACPGGLEVATVMLEILDDRGWNDTWKSCDGLRICDRVRVWLDGYQDMDYEQAFLLRVWTDTDTDEEGRSLTVTDHLAVYRRHAGTSMVDVEWRNDPRLFFDADGDWTVKGLHWWVDTIVAMCESRADASRKLSPQAESSISEHNDRIGREQVALARKLGLTLPYLRNG